MQNLHIQTYQAEFKDQIIQLILNIQQNEFNLPINLEKQADLLDIPNFYQQKKGDFWLAILDNQLVGTIALIDIENGQGVIRKMFIKKEFRGKTFGIASNLLAELMTKAKNAGINELYLGTIDKLEAAQRFYQKNLFEEIEKTDLPSNFPIMAVDNVFFKKKL